MAFYGKFGNWRKKKNVACNFAYRAVDEFHVKKNAEWKKIIPFMKIKMIKNIHKVTIGM